jgi:phosphatidylglycerol---prolipoprotein diacylglyceryl transferase
MSATLVHTGFDVLAWIAVALSYHCLTRGAAVKFPPFLGANWHYIAVLVFGAGVSAVSFGTANLWLSQQAGFARSIEGAIAGGILAVELYKRRAHITARTGARFALPFAVGVAIGRIGCYLAGLDDFTYGTPTTLPWGHDFGDGVPRHPVQLYESAAMAAFAAVYVARALKNDRFVIENGFYFAAGYYGFQRFLWEFIKPYGLLIGPFTLFHVLSVVIFLYAVIMIATAPRQGILNDRAFT